MSERRRRQIYLWEWLFLTAVLSVAFVLISMSFKVTETSILFVDELRLMERFFGAVLISFALGAVVSRLRGGGIRQMIVWGFVPLAVWFYLSIFMNVFLGPVQF